MSSRVALAVNNGESDFILIIARYATECPQVVHNIKCSSCAINVAAIGYTVQTIRRGVIFIGAVELAMRYQRSQVGCIG
jgi:hypothetical protein